MSSILTAILYTCTHWLIVCILRYLQTQWLDYDAMLILSVIMVWDTFFGMGKSYRLDEYAEKEYYPNGNRKNHWFKTRILIDWIMKKIGVFFVPVLLVMMLAGLGLTNDPIFIMGIIMKLLISAEAISAFQNLYVFITGDQIEEFDAIWMALKTIKNIISEVFVTIKDRLVDFILLAIKKKDE